MKDKTENKIAGFLLILSGIFLGLYIGFWIMFIGGVVMLVREIANVANGNNIQLTIILFGIVKILFAGFFGYISTLSLAVPGFVLFNKKD